MGWSLTRSVAVVVGLCGVAVAVVYGVVLGDIARNAENWWAVGLWAIVATEAAASVGFLAGAVRNPENRAFALWSFLGMGWVMALLNTWMLAYIGIW